MPLGGNSIRLQVIVSKEEKKAIEALAKKENRSISNWIYNQIQQKLRVQKGERYKSTRIYLTAHEPGLI